MYLSAGRIVVRDNGEHAVAHAQLGLVEERRTEEVASSGWLDLIESQRRRARTTPTSGRRPRCPTIRRVGRDRASSGFRAPCRRSSRAGRSSYRGRRRGGWVRCRGRTDRSGPKCRAKRRPSSTELTVKSESSFSTKASLPPKHPISPSTSCGTSHVYCHALPSQ